MTKYENYIFKELLTMFSDDQKTVDNLNIISEYLKTKRLKDGDYEPLDEYITPIKGIKPSVARNKIRAFFRHKSSSGYIQPIGKKKFITRFLERYPSPRCVQRTAGRWRRQDLFNYIKTKYHCNISKETIRKELQLLDRRYTVHELNKVYRLHLEKIIDNYQRNSRPIYIMKFFDFPIDDFYNSYGHKVSNHSDIVVYIYSLPYDNANCTSYKRSPFFKHRLNTKTYVSDLAYFLQIFHERGLILVNSNKYTKGVLRIYNKDRHTIGNLSFFTEKIFLCPDPLRNNCRFLQNDFSYPLLTEELSRKSKDEIWEILKFEPEFKTFANHKVVKTL